MDKENKYLKALTLFCSTDELRQGMLKPFKQSNFIYATDARALIQVPVNLYNIEYESDISPKISFLLEYPQLQNIKVDVNELKQKLIPVMIKEVIEIECDECNGDGYVDYIYESKSGIEYQEDHNCPICMGDGFMGLKETGNMIEDVNHLYNLHGVLYSFMQIDRLIKTCEIIGANEITILSTIYNKGNWFKCGEIKILIMPCTINNTIQNQVITKIVF